MPTITVPPTFDEFDVAVDEAWEPLRHIEPVDRAFYAASEAANFSMIWHGLSLARALATRDWRQALRTSAALGIESAVVNGPIKSLFERERPTEAAELPRKLRQPKTSSFPSGHASAAAVAAAYLTDGAGPAGRWGVRGLAAVVATSRIHVRIHHASDVIAGALTGWALLGAIRPLLRRILG